MKNYSCLYFLNIEDNTFVKIVTSEHTDFDKMNPLSRWDQADMNPKTDILFACT